MSEVSESRMVRKPWRSDLGSALNKGAWSSHEDLLLKNYVEIHGEGHWSILPHKTGLQRCGRSCRLRWMNYLRPDVKHDNISADEEELIIRLHNILGNRWSLIAARLPGRTDNQIKNVWYSRLSKIPAKKLTQHCSVIKPVPYKYNLPSPDKFFVTANAGFTAERKENDNANDLLFQPANYNSGNAEDQMKQAPASPDIQELIVNFPGWQHFKAKDLPFIEIHNSFGYSDIVDNIVDQGFSWASSSMSPTHFNSFLASATHFQGSDYAHLTSTVPNANYVNIYGENQQPYKKKHTSVNVL